jgi:SAM-dependent methyltransferase
MAIGASYHCTTCRSSLRYQGQARVLVDRFARHGSTSVAALCGEPEFRDLRIWEPGELGPFRKPLRPLSGYETSSYWPDVAPGDSRDGVRCEDLTALTYPSESFDLVITSDVFEHVRHPYLGFAEVHRVLRPGGAHVFSVPVRWPLRPDTIVRVDVSGEEDILLMEPVYHRVHLVYNDFGEDMLTRLAEIGFETEVVRFKSDHPPAARLLTFCSVKPE